MTGGRRPRRGLWADLPGPVTDGFADWGTETQRSVARLGLLRFVTLLAFYCVTWLLLGSTG